MNRVYTHVAPSFSDIAQLELYDGSGDPFEWAVITFSKNGWLHARVSARVGSVAYVTQLDGIEAAHLLGEVFGLAPHEATKSFLESRFIVSRTEHAA